jgi:hypothetical protein
LSLPRFGGVAKRGIYSTEGGEDAKATEDLHPGVQTGGGPAREEQWETDEPNIIGGIVGEIQEELGEKKED